MTVRYKKEEIFTLEDACNYLKVSRHTLCKYTHNKKMPSFRVGKELRFRKSSVYEPRFCNRKHAFAIAVKTDIYKCNNDNGFPLPWE